ncbi:MAG: high-affinity nickel-transporter [Chloroflexi bacterium]|nr:high-affinity nickel-transporter [Chloroflexota bacterium]
MAPFIGGGERALAHPLGNFTINRYTRIEVSPSEVRLRYVVDMAEIPTFAEITVADANNDGQVSDDEASTYALKRQDEIAKNLHLALNGSALNLDALSHEIAFLPGQGGLKTLRLGLWYSAPLHADQGKPVDLAFRDDNYGTRLGWKEIVVTPSDGVTIAGSSVPSHDVSNELISYPNDLLKSPLDVREAKASFTITGIGSATGSTASASPNAPGHRADFQGTKDSGFAGLITKQRLSAGVIALALLAAMGFGALHALGPGHGKAIVAAYLIGSKGTPKHAVFLGLTVTATHCSTVFALGLITLFAERLVAPEHIFLWLGVASGLMVVAMGLLLFVSRLRQSRLWPFGKKRDATEHAHAYHGHDHTNDHDRDHSHAHGHDHSHEHVHAVTHSHGGGEHSHLPPGADGAKVTWRSLLALGVSGGLLPCPSALVVMLGSIALNRVGLGLVLIIAFSLGLAATLTAIGMLFVGARSMSARFHGSGRFARFQPAASLAMRLLPMGSALAITGAGLAITVKALSQAGVGL